ADYRLFIPVDPLHVHPRPQTRDGPPSLAAWLEFVAKKAA
ncbi:hypothetical protein GBF38_017954, partial [Nibea albiflora]